METATVRGELCVSIRYEEFVELIRSILGEVEVDEAWYLSQYPDVLEGIRTGAVQSAKQHFADSGYFEGRLPFQILIDEDWYQREYPDVAESVRQGTVPSGQVHFDTNGYREGRLPFDPNDGATADGSDPPARSQGSGLLRRAGLVGLLQWQQRSRRNPAGAR